MESRYDNILNIYVLIFMYIYIGLMCIDGKTFEIIDPKRLESEILPQYFRHGRFQSLVRQLNFYNFKVSELLIDFMYDILIIIKYNLL